MAAAVPPTGAVGLKAYLSTANGTRFAALLWDSRSGELLAIMEADWLGRIRTGAASGLATRLLAREDAGVLGVSGAGGQSSTQIEAIAAVRPLREVKIYSRRAEPREALAREMAERLGLPACAVRSAEEAVRGSDIVTTITTARQPVLHGAWFERGCHINAAGSNGANRRELDNTAVERSTVIAVDSMEQARSECGDLIGAAEAGGAVWDRVRELGAIIAGHAPGRQGDEDITLFESQGVALEDVVAARYVYDRAIETGRGTQIDFGSAPA
jgi:ornithine cyclodeaminase/alanine dehydrogenase-like protein (mu-crystallin family)